MSWQASKWAAQQVTGSAAAKAVLMVLAEAADAAGFTFLGHAEIATRAEVTPRTVIAAMRRLDAAGLTSRRRRWNPADGSRTSNGVTLALQSEAVSPRDEPKGNVTAVLGETGDGPKCSSFTLTGQEPPSDKSEGGAPKRAPATAKAKGVKAAGVCALPDGFPEPELIARARAKFTAAGVRVDAAEEVEKFRDHHTAKGSKFVDWSAAFLGTWCGRAVRYAKEDGRLLPRVVVPAQVSAADEWAARLRGWKLNRYWDVSEWGPRPGEVGSKAPVDLLDGAEVVPLRRAVG